MRFMGPVLTSTIKVFALLGLLHFAVLSLSCSAQDTGNASFGDLTAECPASGSDNIAITVEVTDKAGHPITGLEAADFKLFDNRQPQKILAFRAVDVVRPPAVPLSVQIIIDAVNSDPRLVAQERDGVSAFLKQNPGRLEYSTSIWLLDSSELTQIAGPSRDGTALLATFNEAPLLSRVIHRSAAVRRDIEAVLQGTALLKEMVSPDSRTPGRKLVLFLSPGWPFNFEPDQPKSLFDDIVKISNGLRESCISLYALDPSGLGGIFNPFSSGFSRSSAFEGFLKAVTKSGDAHYGNLSLQVLAEHSGGHVIIEGNDIKAEINTALRGAAGWYNLVFERAPGGRTTEYHAILVTVDKPRMKVQTTAGYYVNAP
jgi:VWFA-related protein